MSSEKSTSATTLVVTSSVVPSSLKDSTLRKLVTSVLNVSSEYLNPDTTLNDSLRLSVVCPYTEKDSLPGFASVKKSTSAAGPKISNLPGIP